MALSEAKHQSYVLKWSQQPYIRKKWPELSLLYHIKNETQEGAARVAVDKSMGVKKGVPDLCLPVARGNYHGLYIEMKTDKGRTTSEQNWWIEHLSQQGNFAEVCHGWESAVRVLEWYLSLPGGETDG